MSGKPTRRLPPTGGKTPVERMEMAEFGRRVHDLRVARGLSQSDLAREIWGEHTTPEGRRVAKNRDRISQYEMGKSFPEPENFRRLADVLGVSPEELGPEIVASTVEREDPAIAMTAAPGHLDKVYLRVNMLVPLVTAAQIVGLLSALSGAGHRRDVA